MHRYARLVFLLAMLLCAFVSAVPSLVARLTPLAAVEALPASNPYRDALLRLERLPPEERQLLGAWLSPDPDRPAPAPTAAQRQLAADIAAALRTAAAHPPTTARDWPLIANPEDPDNPAAISLLSVGSVRELARLAVKSAETLPPEDAIDVYAAVAQLGRQQRSGATLIEQLVGVAIEGVAQGEASKRLGEYSPEALQKLSAAWAGLHPTPTNAEAVAGERELFFRPIVERFIVPGLRSLLADPQAGQAEPDTTPGAGFTRDLRLSALMDLGGGERRIVLESTKTGESLALRTGAIVEGVELLSLDFEKRLAVIRHGAREAVIHLESKRIVERQNAARRLREMFGQIEALGQSSAGPDVLAKLIELARLHPRGPAGYGEDLLAAYKAEIDRQLERADSPEAPVTSEHAPSSGDPLLAMITPTIGSVVRTLNNSSTAATMLQAAIHHRLAQLGEGERVLPPADPWAENDGAFSFEAAPDGGFFLRSRYERDPAAPLTYKFAAPDAGLIRAK